MGIRHGKALGVAAGVFLCGVSLSACGSSSSGGGGKQVKIAYLTQAPGDYGAALFASAQSTAKAAGGSVKLFNANYDPSTQQTQCLDAITQGYTGLLVWAVDSGSMKLCAKKAKAAGVKVVASESPIGPDFDKLTPQVPGVDGSVFMPTTYEGAAAADLVVKACGNLNPCKLGYIQGGPTTSYGVTKLAAVRERLKAHPNVKLVARGESQYLASGGQRAAQDMLVAQPGLNVILTDDDDSAGGIYLAVKAAGKQSQVKIIGTGAGTLGVKAIKSGQEYGSVTYYPTNAARAATDMLIKAIRGQAIGQTGIAHQSLIPADQRVATKANVDKITPQWGPKSEASAG